MEFLNSLANDFSQTFLVEQRYLMYLDGIKMTIVISLGAVVIGIGLGLLLAIMKLAKEQGNRKQGFSRIITIVLAKIAGIYVDIIRGTPTVVQLMIISVLLFRSRFGMVAGIVAFGINSAAYVSEIIRAGILSVNKGQMEAGRSLGFSYAYTMRYIIIPQAIKNILPALGNEFIVLVKETAVVGMIGVMDLMKASDFVISRTFKAAMPLLSVAVIYYVMLKILAIGLNAFERRLRKSDIR